MKTENTYGDKVQPCLTPLFTQKQSDTAPFHLTETEFTIPVDKQLTSHYWYDPQLQIDYKVPTLQTGALTQTFQILNNSSLVFNMPNLQILQTNFFLGILLINRQKWVKH